MKVIKSYIIDNEFVIWEYDKGIFGVRIETINKNNYEIMRCRTLEEAKDYIKLIKEVLNNENATRIIRRFL